MTNTTANVERFKRAFDTGSRAAIDCDLPEVCPFQFPNAANAGSAVFKLLAEHEPERAGWLFGYFVGRSVNTPGNRDFHAHIGAGKSLLTKLWADVQETPALRNVVTDVRLANKDVEKIASRDGEKIASLLALCNGLPVSRAEYLLTEAVAWLKQATVVDSRSAAFQAMNAELQAAADSESGLELP